IVDVKDQQGLAREIDRLKAVELAVRRKTIESAVEPIRGWASAIKDELQPGLQTIRSLQKLADRVRPLLLLVDDDEFQHKLLRRMLSDVDCDLVSALSGRDAMAALRNCRPDLILMDVQLPDLHGVELTRRIHASDQFARLPILMITGQSDKGVVVESIKAGASGFLVKPIAKDLLLAKIRNSLQGPAADSAA
ncbi:MAG: response regulator, partial [Rhodoferax sp.]|nr:response regulator [Rhodoferax sp.]